MLITIVLLSYNNLSTIKEAINSVLFQDYSPIQLIVTDDGTEGFDCSEIEGYIKANARQNIAEFKVVKQAQNVGTIRNLNGALKLASGQIVFNLASDDAFNDEKVISEWVEQFERTGAGIITAKRAMYDSALEKLIRIEPYENEVEIIKNSSPSELFEYIAPANRILGCCTARTRENIERYGYYDQTYRCIEDYPMVLKLLREGEKIEIFDRVVVKYRSAGVSSSTAVPKWYLKENRLVFKNEGLPYVKSKAKARRKYRLWKDQIWLGKRISPDRNIFVRMGAFFVFYLFLHPIKGCKKLFSKPKAMIKIFRGYTNDSE